MRCTAFLAILLFTLSGHSQEWIPVKGPKPFGISGMALLDKSVDANRYLIVHDNKADDEGRLAIVVDYGLYNEYRPVLWPDSNNMPKDLESITAIPDRPREFFVMTSLGNAWHIFVDSNDIVSILKYFRLPTFTKSDNFEGLSLQQINTNLLIFWAHRGEDAEPGVVYSAIFDFKTYQTSYITQETLSVPWPIRSHVRHISDLKVDATGILYVISASDPGDDGPFTSAVYLGGVYSSWGTEIHFRKTREFTRILTFYNRKAEAMELVPGPKGGLILGSDDENQGGSICKTWPF